MWRPSERSEPSNLPPDPFSFQSLVSFAPFPSLQPKPPRCFTCWFGIELASRPLQPQNPSPSPMDQVSLVKYNIQPAALVACLDTILGENQYTWRVSVVARAPFPGSPSLPRQLIHQRWRDFSLATRSKPWGILANGDPLCVFRFEQSIKVGNNPHYEIKARRRLTASEFGEIKKRSGVTLVVVW